MRFEWSGEASYLKVALREKRLAHFMTRQKVIAIAELWLWASKRINQVELFLMWSFSMHGMPSEVGKKEIYGSS